MIGLISALLAGVGAFLAFSSTTNRPAPPARTNARSVSRTLTKLVGLHHDDLRQATTLALSACLVGGLAAWLIFGGFIAPAVTGLFTASVPIAGLRARRLRLKAEAANAWPHMIEEIRLMVSSLGRPIPQALLEVGGRGPEEMRFAFARAASEWSISTDFERMTKVLRDALDDPTADAVCETLIVAQATGGSDIDARLAALVEDRYLDLQGRKDAVSKQAGVLFARRFVLIVPVGMALAGMSIGNGRAAYATTQGQLGVTVALVVLAACWFWAGRLIRLPQEMRVFRG